MARFAESFIQGLMSPSYQQGLFTAAQGAGSFSRRQQEAEQFKQLTSGAAAGSSVVSRVNQLQQLSIQAARRGDTANARAYEAAANQLQTNLKTQGQQSISAIQQQLMTETDPTRMKELEDAMVSVARQTQQTDPSAFIGVADKVLDQRTQRENEQIRQNNLLFSQREAAIAQAYFGVSNEDKEQFVKNAEKAGFGKIVTQLENDRLRHEQYLEDRERSKADAKAPLNIPAMEKRIESLPANQQAAFKERLDEIKKLEPNFEEGGTWGTGERERAWRQLDSLDRALFSANASIISTTNSRIKTLDTRLNAINKDLNKPATNQEAKLYLTEAVSQVSKERGTLADFLLTDVESADPRVKQRAIELATEAKNVLLMQEKEVIETELTELQKTFEPSSPTKETTQEPNEEDPLGIKVK